VDPAGIFVPRGRADRHVVVIDHAETATSRLADEFIRLRPGQDLELISALRQIIGGGEVSSTAGALSVPGDMLNALAARMRGCRYGALFYGPRIAKHAGDIASIEALFQLVRELNSHARFTVRGLRSTCEVVGADGVLSWLTGFPFAVNFAAGYPRFDPEAYSANGILERGEADACLFVGSSGVRELSAAARTTVTGVPTIALDYPNASLSFDATVSITTAIHGIHAPGTANRMDEVTIPLRQFVETDLPTDEAVLEAVRERVGRLRSRSRAGEQ
jgi:formylmethanofuran dehydrogenase subunit B